VETEEGRALAPSGHGGGLATNLEGKVHDKSVTTWGLRGSTRVSTSRVYLRGLN
jgi:hypothetical protein